MRRPNASGTTPDRHARTRATSRSHSERKVAHRRSPRRQTSKVRERREDLRERRRPRGRRGCRTATARTDPGRCTTGAEGAAAVHLQQPNVCGCREPAPDLAAAAKSARRSRSRHVDPPVARGPLRPGGTGARDRTARVKAAGNPGIRRPPSAPAARQDSSAGARRIVRRTGDAAASAACPHPQTRERTSAREGDVESRTNQTHARARRFVYSGSGRRGSRVGETVSRSPAYAKAAAARARRAEMCLQNGQRSRVCRPSRTERPDVVKEASERGVHPICDRAGVEGMTTPASSGTENGRRPRSTVWPTCSPRWPR